MDSTGLRRVSRRIETVLDFQLHVMDSHTLFAGGVLEAVELSTPCNGFPVGHLVKTIVTGDRLSTPCNGFMVWMIELMSNKYNALSTPCNGFFVERMDVEVIYEFCCFQLHVMDSHCMDAKVVAHH